MVRSELTVSALGEVPGAFIMLGASPPGTDPHTARSNHSAAVFDDSVLVDGTTLYPELAVRYPELAVRRLARGA